MLANKKLKEIYAEKEITWCEVQEENCQVSYALSWHHRKPRVEYRRNPEMLSNFNETLLVCHVCHSDLHKHGWELSEYYFKELREET